MRWWIVVAVFGCARAQPEVAAPAAVEAEPEPPPDETPIVGSIAPREDESPWARTYVRELGERAKSCNRDDTFYRCFCAAACRFTPSVKPPSPITTLRYPFVDVDGWTVELDADGRATACGLTMQGRPEVAFHVTCQRTDDRQGSDAEP